MSRLFSRLENISAGAGESSAFVPDGKPAPAASAAENGAAPASDTAGTPSILPGYAISSRLAIAPVPPVTSPDWPVRLWFFSLIFLTALSLIMLVLPERLYSPSPQQPPPAVLKPEAAPLAPAPAAPTNAAVFETAPAPAAVQTPTPASVPRPEPRIIAAPADAAQVPAQPAAPAQPAIPAQPAVPASGTAACSEAMVALNLCSSSTP